MLTKATKSNNYHYNKSFKELASENRRNMNKSEACLWKYVLSRKQMHDFQFRRQRPILDYIVDFVCFELMLIIEVDGWTHEIETNVQKDQKRDEVMSTIGFTTLRFSSWEVLNRMTDVSMMISEWIESRKEK